MKVIVYALVAAVLGLSAMSGYNIEQIQASRADARAQQRRINQNQSDALRTVLCFAESAALTNRKSTDAKKQAAVHFFEGALAKIHALPCPPPHH